MNEITKVLDKQRSFYATHKTDNYHYRKRQLMKLKRIIRHNEKRLLHALYLDLHKSDFESYLSELALVYQEIDYQLKHLRKNMKNHRVRTPLMLFKASSFYRYDSYGQVLIIGPFNYPVQLVLVPLIGAIATGNTAMIKPSENAENVGMLLKEIINEEFKEEYIHVVDFVKGKKVVEDLLKHRFDLIFFTGSTEVGRIIAEKAASFLTPVILELGGKSPCIVDRDANLKMSAKRIVWGKLINAGQTCIAPDYLLVHKNVKDQLIKEIIVEIEKQYSKKPDQSNDYGRMINKKALNRMRKLLKDNKIIYGGDIFEEELYVSPTLIEVTDEKSEIMKEEIFGPLLPIVTFSSLDSVIMKLNNLEKPLALYYFGKDKHKINKIIQKTRSGGLVINDTLIQYSNNYLPFGGVGLSGIGSYHGQHSFESFSHRKSVVKRSLIIEFPFRFAPSKNKLKFLKKVIK